MTDNRIPLSDEIKAARADLQDTLGYQFTNTDLLAEALTHPSVIKQNQNITHNQRLEFLGDRVIGLVIADALFGATDQEREGVLTRRYADCVENTRLSEIARDLNIGPALLVQHNSNLDEVDKVLADALEALIGAIWRDGGIDAVRRVILQVWTPMMDQNAGDVKDFKTQLQEFAHKQKINVPKYKIVEQLGLDHAPLFTIMVSCGNYQIKAQGSSKRLAEQAAAEAWLEHYAHKPNANNTRAVQGV